ncbi:ATP-binding cassette sub-family B member 10, mitochondrial [Fukomys damarensis]|uniref:ATP-binding cassette sub-family B member 10, mitochondrial n=1 Tax=Fukomys damarensis TaxID=885580 RepID=A0A091E2G6_FUKDA|nr:ATP-binding cassette sub-family B member 10, mitochondrial [Fukomys damarensis]
MDLKGNKIVALVIIRCEGIQMDDQNNDIERVEQGRVPVLWAPSLHSSRGPYKVHCGTELCQKRTLGNTGGPVWAVSSSEALKLQFLVHPKRGRMAGAPWDSCRVVSPRPHLPGKIIPVRYSDPSSDQGESLTRLRLGPTRFCAELVPMLFLPPGALLRPALKNRLQISLFSVLRREIAFFAVLIQENSVTTSHPTPTLLGAQ